MLCNEEVLKDIANRLRLHSIRSTNAAKSGHPTSCASLAEILSVLFFDIMRYKVKEPKDPANDRFILSKGHAAPILYAAWAEAGLFPTEDLISLRSYNSSLEGHPTPRLSFIDVATGSLGQGLGISAGMAYVGKYIDKANYRTYCVIGDGESAEGSNWEAMAFASYYKLDNLCAIFDINRLGQSGPTALEHQMHTYQARICAFGFETFVVDGHNVKELSDVFRKAMQVKDKPQAILAKTFKGKGFVNVQDKENWHGKPLSSLGDAIIEDIKKYLLPNPANVTPQAPDCCIPDVSLDVSISPPSYEIDQMVSTRQTYGTALVKLGQSNERIFALDGDTKNSTFSETYMKNFPDRYIECFIAEQNLVAVGVGLGCRNRCIPFVSTFACFFTRAFDHIRMAAISQANLKFVGSHCGVSIGEDGPSQMGLEDIAMFRTVPGCNVFYPSDAVSMERATELAAQHKGMDYIRTSRPATKVIYKNDEKFEIGKCKVVLSHGSKDSCLIIGAGITLFEAFKAAELLKTRKDINVRIIDPFTIKPLDVEAIQKNAKECNGCIVVVEDHYAEGGIGEAIASALSMCDVRIKSLAIRKIARSGPPQKLIDEFGIGSMSIVEAVESFL